MKGKSYVDVLTVPPPSFVFVSRLQLSSFAVHDAVAAVRLLVQPTQRQNNLETNISFQIVFPPDWFFPRLRCAKLISYGNLTHFRTKWTERLPRPRLTQRRVSLETQNYVFGSALRLHDAGVFTETAHYPEMLSRVGKFENAALPVLRVNTDSDLLWKRHVRAVDHAPAPPRPATWPTVRSTLSATTKTTTSGHHGLVTATTDQPTVWIDRGLCAKWE